MNTPRLLFAAACLWAAVSTARAATIVWDGGGGDYSWQTATNWDGDVVPGPGDDVVINVSSNLTVSSSADVTVKSLQCSNNLAIVGGAFGVTAGASVVHGVLNLSSGTTFWASGSGTTLTASSPANLDGCSFSASGGATFSLPGLRSYVKTGCVQPNWQASGAGSALVLAGLTNITANSGCYPFRVQALAGAQVLLPNLVNAESSDLIATASGTNSVLDFGSLATAANCSFYADTGGTVLLPSLRTYQKAGGGLQPTWQASGQGSVLVLGSLTNIVSVWYYDLKVNALAGGQVLLTNLISLDGAVNVLAEGTNSVVDFAKLITATGVGITAQNGGEVLLPALTDLNNSGLGVSGGSVLGLPSLRSYQKAGGGLQPTWQASGQGSVLVLGSLTNIVSVWYYDLKVNALAGGQVLLTNLISLDGAVNVLADGTNSVVDLSSATDVGKANLLAKTGGLVRAMGLRSFSFTAGDTFWQADGPGSSVDLSGLTNVVVLGNVLYVQAYNGGLVNLSGLRTASGPIQVLASGSNSVVDMSALTSIQGAVTLEIQDGGKILFSSQPFFLTGVTIIMPPAAPILPPTLIFHGQAWHSYRIEQRNTSQPDNPWVFAARVALTNELQAFAPSLPPDTEFRAFDFVADPYILDLWRLPGPNVQLVLYGATNKTYAVYSTNRLTAKLGDWPVLATVSMTNAFRIFPPTPTTEPQLFFRAKE